MSIKVKKVVATSMGICGYYCDHAVLLNNLEISSPLWTAELSLYAR